MFDKAHSDNHVPRSAGSLEAGNLLFTNTQHVHRQPDPRSLANKVRRTIFTGVCASNKFAPVFFGIFEIGTPSVGGRGFLGLDTKRHAHRRRACLSRDRHAHRRWAWLFGASAQKRTPTDGGRARGAVRPKSVGRLPASWLESFCGQPRPPFVLAHWQGSRRQNLNATVLSWTSTIATSS